MTNEELPVPFPDIFEKTGIRIRQFTDETVEDIAVALGRETMRRIGIDARDCSAVLLASCTARPKEENGTMKVAATVAERLGIEEYDGIDFACSGFPAAVQRSLGIVRRHPSQHVLLLQVETLSRICDWSDGSTALLFGDGAASVTVTGDGPHEILDAEAQALDDPEKLLGLENAPDTLDAHGNKRVDPSPVIFMEGKKLYRDVPDAMLRLVRWSLGRTSPEKLTGPMVLVPHQANGKFAGKIEKLMGRDERFAGAVSIEAIEDRANIAAASIPSALARKWDEIEPGSVVLCPAKGAGPAFRDEKLTEGIVTFRKGAE